jgi:hypothetical protein
MENNEYSQLFYEYFLNEFPEATFKYVMENYPELGSKESLANRAEQGFDEEETPRIWKLYLEEGHIEFFDVEEQTLHENLGNRYGVDPEEILSDMNSRRL